MTEMSSCRNQLSQGLGAPKVLVPKDEPKDEPKGDEVPMGAWRMDEGLR